MKTKTLIITAAGALFAGAALAASPYAGGKGGQASFPQLDTDEDGVITRQEIDAARAERFARLDRNGDGKATAEEFELHRREMMQNRMMRGFQYLDADGDGVVTQAEHDAVAGKMMSRMDRNGDGEITRDEMGRKHRRGDCRNR